MRFARHILTVVPALKRWRLRFSTLLPVLVLTGCWKLDDPLVDYASVAFGNSHVATSTFVVEGFSTGLECPNGDEAYFYAVYDPNVTEEQAVAVVYHSGAFDYVLNPVAGAPMAGPHYAGDSRMSGEWSIGRAWMTLGMTSDQDSTENHTGALPAQLVREGVVTLLPANCWGDLWHNEQGYTENDWSTEGFQRNGRTLAYWMVRMVNDAGWRQDKGFDFGVDLDPDQLYLIGLGDGGRAVTEVLLRGCDYEDSDGDGEIAAGEWDGGNDWAPAGVMIDSTPDNLTIYTEDPSLYTQEIVGLRRIFVQDEDAIDDYDVLDDLSLRYAIKRIMDDDDLPGRSVVLWSSADTQLPDDGIKELVNYFADDDSALVIDTEQTGHVFSNADSALAEEALDFLLGAD